MPTPAATSRRPTDMAGFLSAARKTGLLSADQFATAADGLPAAAHTAKDAARHFTGCGALTPFQADRILAGRTDGFVIGQYAILEPLGHGSAGRVYKAEHRAMHRVVAVSVLPPDRCQSADARAAFQKEVKKAARLAHPNVLTVLDANQIAGRLYVVFEHAAGATLEAVVRDRGPLPVAVACDVAAQAAAGLHHAHERGMTHGSVGPANLLLGTPRPGRGDRPAVKVLNFGLSHRAVPDPAADPANPAAGSDAVEYLAPEQFDPAAKAGPPADLFALGCTLFFALTGGPPAPPESAGELEFLHQFAPPVPVEELRPDLPAAVAAVVNRLLARDPNDRPASAAEVAALLEPFAGGGDGAVSYDLPPAAGPQHSGGTHLTGIPTTGYEPSPFEGLDDLSDLSAVTLDGSAADTKVLLPKYRGPVSAGVSWRTAAALAAVAVAIIGGAVLAIGAVVRAVAK